ncbi:MAG: DUF2911 domain-containing protein [Bacteroidota bacterium]
MHKSSIWWSAVVSFLFLATPNAKSQLETPQPSPKARIEQRVGIMDVAVSYSRPSVKGRKIFGDLVPYGQVWRTGANDPTTISFSDQVKLEGTDVPAGTYSLYTIPGESEWTIIINKKTTGGAERVEKEDQTTFKVKPSRLPMSVETFTINISDITANAANLELMWENTGVKFRMEFDVETKVMAAIKEATASPFGEVANMYFQSASYYYAAGKDLKTALEWVNKSIELNDNAFWVWRLQSQIQAGLKDYKAAIASAEASKSRAQKAGNAQYVKFNDDAIAEWKTMK